MNKEKRLSLIKEYRDKYCPDRDIDGVISSFAAEDLTYAAIISRRKNLILKEEFEKVLNIYAFQEYNITDDIAPLIKRYLDNPIIAAMQHCIVNYISYLGEFYDGTPCGNGKPFHTFDVEWVG